MYVDEKNRKKLYKSALDKMKKKSKLSGEDWWVFRGLHNEPFKIFWSSEKKNLYKYMDDYLFSLPISEMNEEELFTFRHL